MVLPIILIIILPFVEHFGIVLLGLSTYAIFASGFARSNSKVELIVLFLLSIVMDVTFTLSLGTYLFVFSLSFLLDQVLERILDQSNIFYSLLTKFLFFYVFLIFRSVAFNLQNGGGVDFGSVSYFGLLIPSIISTALYLGISYSQRQLRGESGVLKLS